MYPSGFPHWLLRERFYRGIRVLYRCTNKPTHSNSALGNFHEGSLWHIRYLHNGAHRPSQQLEGRVGLWTSVLFPVGTVSTNRSSTARYCCVAYVHTLHTGMRAPQPHSIYRIFSQGIEQGSGKHEAAECSKSDIRPAATWCRCLVCGATCLPHGTTPLSPTLNETTKDMSASYVFQPVAFMRILELDSASDMAFAFPDVYMHRTHQYAGTP